MAARRRARGACAILEGRITHTHQSPGNFSSSSSYNTFASPRPGFDRRLFEFLAHRIAEAVLSAVRSARPAVVAYAEGHVAGLARNRSLSPFLHNVPEAAAILAENAWLPEAPGPGEYLPPPGLLPSGIIYRAVSPRLGVMTLRARADADDVIAVAAFVAAHPTSLSHNTPLYTSDFFGVAAVLVERALRKKPVRSEWCVTWLGRLPAEPGIEARFNVITLDGDRLYAPVQRSAGSPPN